VISHATMPNQRMVVGTLADIGARARDAALDAPALFVVGEVVGRAVASPALVAEIAAGATKTG
jgi:siroheme synthase